ncbi:hypothetical protein SDC9_91100 [bioreactor metagenome]|uniref:Uncharacterized protein n=1 Tax=bioreactor metagenome TaxID=1076179 RepID=A0A644ZU88_9ZZZZ
MRAGTTKLPAQGYQLNKFAGFEQSFFACFSLLTRLGISNISPIFTQNPFVFILSYLYFRIYTFVFILSHLYFRIYTFAFILSHLFFRIYSFVFIACCASCIGQCDILDESRRGGQRLPRFTPRLQLAGDVPGINPSRSYPPISRKNEKAEVSDSMRHLTSGLSGRGSPFLCSYTIRRPRL